MDSLKSLLTASLQRNQITKQVTISRMIEEANEAAGRMLPGGRSEDATAVAVRDGTVVFQCRHAAAASLLAMRAAEILDAIKRELPSARVDRIQTRIGV